MIRVWDPVVRIFHWGLAACFAAAWFTADEAQGAHEWFGYTAAALVAARVFWGLVGSHYARFIQFVRGPQAVLSYLGAMISGREPRYIGHNPAGAAMSVAIMIAMSGTALTGWQMAEPSRQAMVPAFVAPALADEEEEGSKSTHGDEALEDIHEALANLMLLLIVIHLGGVALASFRHRENLARAMITGLKRPAEPADIA